MIAQLDDLAAVLEEEIAVGEELRRNLAARRKALIDWDIEALLAGIEAREPWLRYLGDLDERRRKLLPQGTESEDSATLSRLIAQSPIGSPVRQRLQTAQSQARTMFTRLQAEELSLNRLMRDLHSHIQNALSSITGSAVSLYGDSGVPEPQRAASALIHNRA